MMASTRRARRQHSQQRTGVLLGIAGAVIASLLVYQVFVRSDDATPTSLGPVHTGTVSGGTTTTTSALEPSLPNGSFNELSLRDPFEPPTQFTPGGTTSSSSTTTTTNSGTISTTPTTSPAQNPAPTTRDYEKVSKSFQRLRQTIEKLIPIPSEAFVRDGNRWRPRFQIQLDEEMETVTRRYRSMKNSR